MTPRYWFRRRPPPRQSKVRPIAWQGYALIIGAVLMCGLPTLMVPRFGIAAIILFPIWLLAVLALLFALVARRTEP